MRFSILIPVYNTAKYIEQCIQSVIQQDFNDYEIILTDDGSTDDSKEICEKYALGNHKIRFYSRENKGLLATRREQLKLCNGDYVLFLDSDDYWQDGLLSFLSAQIDKCNPDMICFGHNVVDNEGNILERDVFVYNKEQVFSVVNHNIDQFVIDYFANYRLCYLWIKCIKRDIIDIENTYSQFDDVYGEDLLQSVEPVCRAKSVFYMNKAFYNYRQSSNGMGRNLSPSFVIDTMFVREFLYKYILTHNLGNKVEEAFLMRCFKDIVHRYEFLLSCCKNYSEFCYYYNEMKQYQVFKCAVNNVFKNNCGFHFIRRKFMIRIPFIFYFLRKMKMCLKG